MEKIKRIVFISWKDIKNPQSGGAEIVQHEISKRFVQDGWKVVSLVPGFVGCKKNEDIDGVEVIRVGESIFSFIKLSRNYIKEIKKQGDILVDVFNCFSSFSYLKNPNAYFQIYHIQDKIWLYERKFPFVFPINLIGWLFEKLQLLFIARTFKGSVITISNSTKEELLKYGFNKDKIKIITMGVDIPYASKAEIIKKNDGIFKVLFIGRMVTMKQPLEAIKAFKIFNAKYPKSVMYVAGEGGEVKKVLDYIDKYSLNEKIYYLGKINNEDKLKYMRKVNVLLVTSIKEGWGLVVTEANSQGTPAVVYDVNGLRDSVKNNITGLICAPNPKNMAQKIEKLYLKKNYYERLRKSAWNFSKEITFDNCYKDFRKIIDNQ